jgi:HTH-type transcriptional regulator/antitoxin HigA
MEQMNLRQIDIAPIFGGKTRVSEVMNRKRPLTLKMITLLNQYLGIPFESLIKGNRNMTLVPEKKNRLLNISQIREYFLKHNNASML